MNIQFPPEFPRLWAAPEVIAAWVSDKQASHPAECENCGGIGTLFIFCATNGPFETPAAPNKVSKFANGKWWIGEHFGASCPVCKGSGRKPGYQPSPRQRQIDWDTVKSVVKE